MSGFVLKNDEKTRVADVTVRLRNVATGAVVGTTTSDGNGAFLFEVPEPGLYVVEAVRDDGRVQAVTDPFQLTHTMALQNVILPGPRGLAALFRSSALAVLAAGAGAGIVALLPPGQVTSPER
ncbi:MAG TPA: SdrD B-like domain-containing protein [Vicinamibacterales bacterium]